VRHFNAQLSLDRYVFTLIGDTIVTGQIAQFR